MATFRLSESGSPGTIHTEAMRLRQLMSATENWIGGRSSLHPQQICSKTLLPLEAASIAHQHFLGRAGSSFGEPHLAGSVQRQPAILRSYDPATAPARNPPRREKFWTLRHSLLGASKTPAERAKISTREQWNAAEIRRRRRCSSTCRANPGPVYVRRGKMPTYSCPMYVWAAAAARHR